MKNTGGRILIEKELIISNQWYQHWQNKENQKTKTKVKFLQEAFYDYLKLERR